MVCSSVHWRGLLREQSAPWGLLEEAAVHVLDDQGQVVQSLHGLQRQRSLPFVEAGTLLLSGNLENRCYVCAAWGACQGQGASVPRWARWMGSLSGPLGALNVHNWLNLEEENVTLNGDPGSEGHCDAFKRPHPFWVLSSWGEGELSEELSWATLVAAV